MIEFLCHDDFLKELKLLERRFPTVGEGLESFKKLSEVEFHPINPEQIINPGKLHRIQQGGLWALWKVELVLPKSGLRPNQWPRMWFAVQGAHIALLCICSHVDNYDDGEVTTLALSRISDIF